MLMFTVFTFIVAGAILAGLFLRRMDVFIAGCFFFSVFQAAAVLNLKLFGNYYIGIQPGYFLSGLGLLALLYGFIRSQSAGTPQFRRALALYYPVLALGAYGAISALFPFIFSGKISVNPPRGGISAENLVLLNPGLTNLSQVAYLLFNVTFSFFVSFEVMKNPRVARVLTTAYVAGGIVVMLLASLQLLSAYTALYFPAASLYSNLGYAQLFFQSFDGIKRLNGPFVEPSVLACYLSGYYAFCLWSFFRTDRPVFKYLSFFSGLLLILSTSFAGYLGFMMCSLFMLYKAIGGSGRIVFKMAFLPLLAVVSALLVFKAEAALSIKDKTPTSMKNLVYSSLTGKIESQSYRDRIATDVNSLKIVHSSYGLGAGLGSTRSSSLFTNILGNLGIPGLLLISWLGYVIASCWRRRSIQAAADAWDEYTIQGLILSIAGSLCVGVLAMPDINSLFLWNILSLLFGLHLRNMRGIGNSKG